MAEISSIKLPNGNNYDFKVYTDHISPQKTKTFTGVIGTANNFADGTFYFGKIIPTDFNVLWKIRYVVKAEAAGSDYAKGYYEVSVSGTADALVAYTTWNSQKNTSYRPIYTEVLYRAKQAGITSGYGHLLGWRLYSSWNAYTATYARTINVEIIECTNCTFTFFDSAVKYAAAPGTGTTNYNTYSEFDANTNGITSTGDRNDPNYQNRIYYSSPGIKSYTAGGRYTLTFTKSPGYVLPITATDNKYNGEVKTYTTESFDPFGDIYYRNTSGVLTADAVVGNSTLYRQYLVDARYSFTGITSSTSTSIMTAGLPVFIVCTPQSDGSAKLYSEPLAFAPPTSDDGRLYILIGHSYSCYQIEMLLHKPVFQCKKGALRVLTGMSQYALEAGNASTVNNHTVEKNVPANAVFTDTTYTIATSSDNGLMSATDKARFDRISGSYNSTTETITLVLS